MSEELEDLLEAGSGGDRAYGRTPRTGLRRAKG
jgi:hypothetical protein